jgi:hypothetical protein
MKAVTYNGKEYASRHSRKHDGEIESYKEGIAEAVAETSGRADGYVFLRRAFTERKIKTGIKSA